METESTGSEKTLPLNLVISKLGMANLSGDKEIMVLQDALDAALMFLEGNRAALARVASAVKETLGDDVKDISYIPYSRYLTHLNNYCLDVAPTLDNAKALWAEFGEVAVNDDDEIEEPFYNFEEGTEKLVIWAWFEETFNISVATDLFGYTS